MVACIWNPGTGYTETGWSLELTGPTSVDEPKAAGGMRGPHSDKVKDQEKHFPSHVRTYMYSPDTLGYMDHTHQRHIQIK